MKAQMYVDQVSETFNKAIDEVLNLIINEKIHTKAIPIEDPKKLKKEFKNQFFEETKECQKEFQKRFHHGIEVIWNSLSNQPNGKASAKKALAEIQEFLESVKQKDTLSEKKVQERAEKSETLRQLFGFSNETIEQFYLTAFALHQSNNIVDAADSFYFLSAIDPWVQVFWMGYGNSEQQLGHFQLALYAYAMATLIDTTDPLPHYFSALCYEQLDNKEEADVAFKLAKECADVKPDQHESLIKIIHQKQR